MSGNKKYMYKLMWKQNIICVVQTLKYFLFYFFLEKDEQGLTAAQRQKIWELAEKAGSSAHRSEPLLLETQTVDALRKKYGGTGDS